MGCCAAKTSLQSCLFTNTYEWTSINLNDEYIRHAQRLRLRMTSSDHQTVLLESVARSCGRRNQRNIATYGGFQEDRSVLWKGFERDEKGNPLSMLHLGIDFNNLVKGEQVKSLCHGEVFHVMHDTSEHNGWGGRLIIKDTINNRFLLYGHLDPATMLKTKTKVVPGDIIATIGEPNVNGGWFRHLHLQIMTQEHVKQYEDREHLIDGYTFDNKLPAGILNPFDVY